VSHSVHLKAPPPDAGPFFESRAAHHRAALSPATPAEYQPPQTGPQFWISCDIWLSFAVMLQEKPRPWLGVRGEAEISGYKTHSRKRLPHQSNSGRGDWFRCQTRKAPPKRGKYILEGKSN
jgi:hypothetical protein